MARKRRVGRPKVSGPRPVFLKIGMTPAQKRSMQQQARTEGLSVTAWLRQLALRALEIQPAA